MKKKVLIIAEAGVNHNGDFSNAKKLIEAAADAGADYVKFQTFKADNLVTKDAAKAEYQIKNINDGDNSQYAMLKKLEMPYEWHSELKKYCAEKGIKFLSTAFDEESIDFLYKLGIDFFKIPSGEITNKPYLKNIAKKGLPVYLSTGMSTVAEIQAAIEVFSSHGIEKTNIKVLHCNTEYPTPMKDVNLKALLSLKKLLGNEIELGYSDHTIGIEVSIAAVAMGAVIIEKHFTLDKNMPGPDHLASLEPAELKEMVKSIRNVELALSGDGFKQPSESELKNLAIVRKSLHYRESFQAGQIIHENNLIALRPGSGVSPMDIDKYVGRELNCNVDAFTILQNSHFK